MLLLSKTDLICNATMIFACYSLGFLEFHRMYSCLFNVSAFSTMNKNGKFRQHILNIIHRNGKHILWMLYFYILSFKIFLCNLVGRNNEAECGLRSTQCFQHSTGVFFEESAAWWTSQSMMLFHWNRLFRLLHEREIYNRLCSGHILVMYIASVVTTLTKLSFCLWFINSGCWTRLNGNSTWWGITAQIRLLYPGRTMNTFK